jgi:predicted porin
MQKKLIALAVAGLVSAPAFAQSNVTIYGLVDVGVTYRSDNATAGVGSKTSIDSGQANGNRLGFRGTEDLGNGLKAGFVLEQGFFVDQGTGRGDGAFSRQSYVSLGGGFGTVALGRQYTFQDNLKGMFDPFGNGTIGQVGNTYSADARYNNMVAYVSPSFSGLTVKLGYSNATGNNGSSAGNPATAGSTSATNEAPGNVGDVRAYMISPVYNNGPLAIGLSYMEKEANDVPGSAETKAWDVALSYNFGMVKLSGMIGNTDTDGGQDRDQYMVGLTAPVGSAGAVLASYNYAENNNAAGDPNARQWALGYTHSLSKRTGLYAVYADISNKDGGLGASLGDASNGGQGYQEGFQLGVRHSF